MIAAKADDARSPHPWLLLRNLGYQLCQRMAILASNFIIDGIDKAVHAGISRLSFILSHFLPSGLESAGTPAKENNSTARSAASACLVRHGFAMMDLNFAASFSDIVFKRGRIV